MEPGRPEPPPTPDVIHPAAAASAVAVDELSEGDPARLRAAGVHHLFYGTLWTLSGLAVSLLTYLWNGWFAVYVAAGAAMLWGALLVHQGVAQMWLAHRGRPGRAGPARRLNHPPL